MTVKGKRGLDDVGRDRAAARQAQPMSVSAICDEISKRGSLPA
jgi:hypothetical protein